MNVLTAYSVADPDLIMYLPMDEGNGDTVRDMSPNSFQGKIIGGDFKWVDGQKGAGLELVSGTEVQVPDHALLDGMKALTLEIWVKQDSHQSTGVIQKGTNWPDMSYLAQPWSDQQIYFGVKDTSSRAIAPPGSYPLGEWYHIAATFDGKTLKLFIDGDEKSEAESPVNQVPDTTTPLQIGNRFTGVIDEFVMYSRALDASEIQRDMKSVPMSVGARGNLAIAWGRIKLATD